MEVSKKVSFISGNFNILHPGHLRLFSFAKEMGNHLIVGVNSDRIAGADSYISENLRLEAIKSISVIDESFIMDEPVVKVLEEIKPNFIVKGKEHEILFNPESEIVTKYGGRLVFSSGEVTFSSFDLIQKEIQVVKQSFNPISNEYLERHDLDFIKLSERVCQFTDLRVIVIGDTIVDEYINCNPLGMSQEDPTIVVTPVESTRYIGGAGIVAAHAAGLGARVNFISVTGRDDMSDFALKTLTDYNVNVCVFDDESRPTTLKQRYRCKGKTLLRVSHLHQGAVDASFQQKILQQVEELINECDLLIFSDFNYGCLPTEVVLKIIEMGKKEDVYMVADSQSSSQVGDISRFNGMSLLSPTEREARLSVRDQESGLVVLAEKLRKQANASNILLKIGEEGVLIHAETTAPESWLTDRIPALNTVPIDVAGAGDSMLIASAMSLASGATIWEAAALGSIAAAVQVSRVGNIPLVTNEILQQLK